MVLKVAIVNLDRPGAKCPGIRLKSDREREDWEGRGAQKVKFFFKKRVAGA